MIWDLFRLCPTPEAAVAADVAKIEEIVKPLGLFRKRAVSLQRFSQEYLTLPVRMFKVYAGLASFASCQLIEEVT